MANSANRIPRFFWYAAALVMLFLLAKQFNFLSNFKKIFSSRPVVIDNTPVLIKEVKNIAQLMSVVSYDEVVVDSSKNGVKNLTGIAIYSLEIPSKDKVVLIGKGKVIAGIDLERLDTTKIFIDKDSVSMLLPPTQILDAIINPSGYEIFSETGKWQPEEMNAVKISARKKMIARCIAQGVLQRSSLHTKVLMENFLRSAGFKKIHFQ